MSEESIHLESDGVSLQFEGHVAVITVNRPEVKNAWNVPTYRAVVRAIEAANNDDAIGSIVLTASGTVYSAGVDFKSPAEPPDETGRAPNVGTLSMARGSNWLVLLAESKPVVAAINGAAIGLGATHVLSTDVRIASKSSYFRFPFLSLGTLPELGSTAFLQRLVGAGRAREILLTGRAVGAAEALNIGLVSAVVDDDELRMTAKSVASKIAVLPRLQVRLTRQLLDENVEESDVATILEREGRAFVALAKNGVLRRREGKDA